MEYQANIQQRYIKMIYSLYLALFLMLYLFDSSQGKLTLKHFPSGTDLEVTENGGRSPMSCEVESDRPYKLSWYKNGKLLSLIKPPLFYFPYATGGATLVMWPYFKNMSIGTYECRATNGVDPPVSYKVKFSQQPENKRRVGFPNITRATRGEDIQVYFGDNVTLHCDAAGKREVFWSRKFIPLHRDSKNKDIVRDAFDYTISKDGATLILFNIRKKQYTEIFCDIANDVGIINGALYIFRANPRPVKPVPAIPPKITYIPRNITLQAPEQWVPFSCVATGTPTPTYFWYHDGRPIHLDITRHNISVVAMRTGKIRCDARNRGGVDSATAYLHVRPLPYRAYDVVMRWNSPYHFTFTMKPSYREKEWHPDIPITHAIIDYRPWFRDMPDNMPYNSTRFKIVGKLPWVYHFKNLKPFTYLQVRNRFVNKYGTGNPSNWVRGNSNWAAITEPVRNLKSIATSNQSFTLTWENPAITNGPVKRYDLYWTRRPNTELRLWEPVHLVGIRPTYSLDWHGSNWIKDIAPVFYWKVRLVGFVNEGPFSETKVFRVCPGAPGFVTNVSVFTIDSRTIQVYWNATKEPGNGIVGHRILYNRQDIPTMERNWKIFDVSKPNVLMARVTGLSPDRSYEVKVYPRSHAMFGVTSEVVSTKTLMDAPSAPPNNVRGLAKSSETLEVYWEPPPEDHQNAPITGYKVFYTRVIGRKPHMVKAGKDDRKLLLQGLGRYTKYIIWVIAINSFGESPQSPTFNIYTDEEVAKGAPRAVRALPLNDTTIAITWLPPDSKLQNGRITGYKVIHVETFYGKVSNYIVEKKVYGEDARDVLIHKWVAANRHYRIQVAAFSLAGDGARSKPLNIDTPPKLPQSPTVKLNMDETRNIVVLDWWPHSPNVTQYKIIYGKSLRKFDTVTNVKEKSFGVDIKKYTLNDLAPGVFYSITVSAKLQKGWTAANINWIKTSDDVPTGPPLFFEGTTESASSLKLKWEEPDPWKRNGYIIGYVVSYRSSKENLWVKVKYDLKDDEDTVIYILMNLKANTRYILKVRALTRVGSGPDSTEIQLKTNKEVLPVVGRLSIMEVENTSSYISWEEPKNANKFKDYTLKYNIVYFTNRTYRDENGKIKLLTLTRSKISFGRQYQLVNLFPGTRYTVSISVDLDEAGVGDSRYVYFTTESSVPRKIMSPVFDKTKEMTDHIPLEIKAASEINGVISYYLLFVINLKHLSTIPSTTHQNQFGAGIQRQRRSTSNRTSLHPEYHIAAFLGRTQLPTLFKLGDGVSYNGYKNYKLVSGYHYVTFVRAFVRKNSNKLAQSDSPFSKSMLYTPTSDSNSGHVGSETTKDSASGSLVIIIAVVASVVVVVALVVILLLYKSCRKTGSESDRLLGTKKRNRTSKSTDPTEVHRLHCNTPGMISHPPIPVDTLARHVDQLKANGGVKFLQEFESIEPSERCASEASLLPQNKTKNRYPNVLAYDDTRVKLDHNGVLSSDYINANYIDGYCKEKAYIATQGPMKNTMHDFWRLCWEQNVQTIVMMTKLEERGRNKCEQYWPTSGVDTYDTVKVELKDVLTLCNYCIRTFEVSSTINGEARTVKHFQYLQWPDPGVPTNPGPVLAFVRRVRLFDPPGSGPTLVHCSAGVGRSACFIAIDAMLERTKYDSMIDIYGYVTMMRSQRNFMVQTDEQYLFVYDVLVEAVEHGNTEIASSDLINEFKKITELRSNGRETLSETQFKSITLAHNYTLDPNLMSAAHSSFNEEKNRCRTIVPFDSNRVVLQLLRSHEGSDYINASSIDGYHTKNYFIATQGPTKATVADFWRMVVEQDSSIIVMLTNLEEKSKEQCFQYWPDAKPMRHHYYVIDPVQENRFANFVVREFKITDARDGKARTIRQYHYVNWPSGRVPIYSEGVIELIGLATKAQKKSENNGPIVVHSSTGAGRTGVFISLSIALESLRTERVVDIYQIVKALRYERPYMVQTLEQYEFCYQVTCDFLRNFDFVI